MNKAMFALPLAALVLGACSESGKDAGVEERKSGDRPVYNMPDNFANLSAVCIKGLLIIETTTRDGAPSNMIHVTEGDPLCAGLDGDPPRAVAR